MTFIAFQLFGVNPTLEYYSR